VDYESTRRVLAALERERVRYVVFGAAALNLHGLARFTEDLDLFVAPDVENVARLKRALRSVFDDAHIEEISSEDLLGEYPAIQYIPPEGTFHIDIVSRLGETWRFDDLEVVRMPFEELTVSVVSPTTLYRMKHDTVRLKDKADAELLKRRFNLKDEPDASS
jgi:Nucleotidyl transferase AbiEii toxin, Type IV TA system